MTLPPDSDATPALLRLRALSTGGDALLYEAADEIERLRAALTRVTTTYDAYRRRGVVPSPVEYADVIVAIEMARAALKETP